MMLSISNIDKFYIGFWYSGKKYLFCFYTIFDTFKITKILARPVVMGFASIFV